MHSWLYYNKTLNSWSNVKYTIKDSICKLGKLHSSLETSLKKKKKRGPYRMKFLKIYNLKKSNPQTRT